MRNTFKIETERLVLRCWAEAHVDPCVQLCADPVVMRYFPDVLTRDRTLKLIGMFRDCFEKHGVFYAPIELKASGEFIGFAGLDVHDEEALPIGGCVDIGWRLKRSAWGRGLASEAARAWLRFGFETIGYEEIVAFTVPGNIPSQKVMTRIGMTHDERGDFQHPKLPEGHAFKRHLLYRMTNDDWQVRTG
ncbi:GNAT family N-acetyltransferase [Roseibium sp.]|uniref:GNAT family N-acetyltransferase n=1 Tax=Roseibium sp. TaxID=1936156 RepID=UPI0035148A0F